MIRDWLVSGTDEAIVKRYEYGNRLGKMMGLDVVPVFSRDALMKCHTRKDFEAFPSFEDLVIKLDSYGNDGDLNIYSMEHYHKGGDFRLSVIYNIVAGYMDLDKSEGWTSDDVVDVEGIRDIWRMVNSLLDAGYSNKEINKFESFKDLEDAWCDWVGSYACELKHFEYED